MIKLGAPVLTSDGKIAQVVAYHESWSDGIVCERYEILSDTGQLLLVDPEQIKAVDS